MLTAQGGDLEDYPHMTKRHLIAAFATLAMTSTHALADRPVTQEERAQLVSALAAIGCNGGEMEFDDGKFEVDDARCADGKKYDLDFDTNFKLLKKELDD